MIRSVFLFLMLAASAWSQSKPEPLDGPNHPAQDDLLDNLQGKWTLKGTILGHPGGALHA